MIFRTGRCHKLPIWKAVRNHFNFNQAPFLDANADQIRAFFRPLTTQQRDRILVTGILQHTQLCEILPLASVVIVGSKAAEAFVHMQEHQ